MKCQSSRSGASNGYVALAAWSFDSEARNRSAATAMWLPVCSTYAPAQRASATTAIAANTRLSLTPRMNVTPFGNTEGCGSPDSNPLLLLLRRERSQAPRGFFPSAFGSTLVSKSSLFTIARIAGIAMETSQAALEPNRYLCLAEQGPAQFGRVAFQNVGLSTSMMAASLRTSIPLEHRSPMCQTKCRVVVAGDLCIDWLSIPIARAVANSDDPPPQNWQLRGGRSMHAKRGGAWLTADFIEAAVGKEVEVFKPESRDDLRSIEPELVIHSLQSLDMFERKRDDKVVKVWAVGALEGFAGPSTGVLSRPLGLQDNPEDADLVLLDDAGNGFRDPEDEAIWPAALVPDRKPIILYKVRRPLLKVRLWQRLVEIKSLDRTIVILRADEVRAEVHSISRHLSWERTVAELLLTLCYDKTFQPLAKCKHVIVTMGLEGVVHLYHEGETPRAQALVRPRPHRGRSEPRSATRPDDWVFFGICRRRGGVPRHGDQGNSRPGLG